jgi:hypothetical protein
MDSLDENIGDDIIDISIRDLNYQGSDMGRKGVMKDRVESHDR